MRDVFSIGDTQVYEKVVTEEDTATFQEGMVHPVCATFALARDMEWSSRLFVLEMKEDHEEGIGTYLTIDHQSPALVGDRLTITAILDRWQGRELICKVTVQVGDRVVATGETGQKILKKEKLGRIFEGLAT